MRLPSRFPSPAPLTDTERSSGRLAVCFKLNEAIDMAHRAGLPSVVTELLGIKQRLVTDPDIASTVADGGALTVTSSKG